MLEQVRVLDLSPYLPTQYCSFSLANLGAEVILVERLRAITEFGCLKKT